MTSKQIEAGTLAVVERFFDAYARNSLSEIEATMSPTVEWRLPPGHPFSPASSLVGRDAALSYLAAMSRLHFKIDSLFAGGNERYAVDIHKVGLEAFEMISATFFTIEHGKIAHIQSLAGDPEGWAALLRERL